MTLLFNAIWKSKKMTLLTRRLSEQPSASSSDLVITDWKVCRLSDCLFSDAITRPALRRSNSQPFCAFLFCSEIWSLVRFGVGSESAGAQIVLQDVLPIHDVPDFIYEYDHVRCINMDTS